MMAKKQVAEPPKLKLSIFTVTCSVCSPSTHSTDFQVLAQDMSAAVKMLEEKGKRVVRARQCLVVDLVDAEVVQDHLSQVYPSGK